MSGIKHIMKYTNSLAFRGDIYPCSKYFCVCIEYLDFGNIKEVNQYKHCYLTDERNKKYEKNNKSYSFKEFDRNYS